MNKSNAISIVSSIFGTNYPLEEVKEYNDDSEVPALQDASFDELCAKLYSVDDNGVMDTPLAKYLNNSVSSELKEFILNNLLGRSTPIVSNFSDKLSDDDMFNLSPRINESLEIYQSRVKNYVDTVYERDSLKELSERQKKVDNNKSNE